MIMYGVKKGVLIYFLENVAFYKGNRDRILETQKKT